MNTGDHAMYTKPLMLLYSLILAIGGLFAVKVILGPVDALVQYLPDDAYYYLQIARHWAATGEYSFDNGYTTTTGFHLLWFYGLGLIARFADGDAAWLLRAGLIVNLVSCLLIAWLGWRLFLRNNPAALGVGALFLSGYAWLNGQIALMEWHLSVLISVAAYAWLYRWKTHNWLPLLGMVVLGILGSLARTDLGGVAFFLMFSAWLVMMLAKDDQLLKPTIALFVGAVIGFALVGLHTLQITGDWIQDNARMKHQWSQLANANPLAPFYQFLRVVFYIPSFTGEQGFQLRAQLLKVVPLAAVPIFIICVFFLLALRKRVLAGWLAARRLGKEHPRKTCLVLAALLTVLGYLVLYSDNVLGIQSWYSAQVFVPMFVVFMTVYSLLRRQSAKVSWLLDTLILLVIIINLVVFAISPPAYHHQESMREAGKVLADAMDEGRLESPVGVPDAGIIGFYTAGRVVNTDGLVNRDITDYFPNRLPCYLLEKPLSQVSGFGRIAENHASIEWEKFATLKSIQGNAERGFRVWQVDRQKLQRNTECTDALW